MSRSVCTAILTPGAITQRVDSVSAPSVESLIMLAEADFVQRSTIPYMRDQLSYSTICISIPKSDLQRMDDLVDIAKENGYRKAGRSWLIRMALRTVDLPALIEQSRKK